MHHGLASLFSKGRSEHCLVAVVQKVIDKGLTAKLVNTLSNLVASSESQTREKRGVLSESCGIGSILGKIFKVRYIIDQPTNQLTHSKPRCIYLENNLVKSTETNRKALSRYKQLMRRNNREFSPNITQN
jgi:hypothetical protein